jgi:hypothetical protein
VTTRRSAASAAGDRVEAGDPARHEDERLTGAGLAERDRLTRRPAELAAHQAQRRTARRDVAIGSEVAGQHPLLQLLDRRRGVEPGVAQPRAEVGDASERLRRAAAAGQRRDQRGHGGLAQRIGEDEGVQARDGLVETAEPHERPGPPLAGGQPQRGEAPGRLAHAREVVVRREGGAAPEPLGLVQEVDRPRGVGRPGGVGRPDLVDQGLETAGVEIVGGRAEPVAARPGLHDVRPESRAQSRHQDLGRVGRVSRRVSGPERVGQPVQRHRPARVRGQECEQGPLAPPRCDRRACDQGLERPEDPHAMVSPRAGHSSSSPGRRAGDNRSGRSAAVPGCGRSSRSARDA